MQTQSSVWTQAAVGRTIYFGQDHKVTEHRVDHKTKLVTYEAETTYDNFSQKVDMSSGCPLLKEVGRRVTEGNGCHFLLVTKSIEFLESNNLCSNPCSVPTICMTMNAFLIFLTPVSSSAI